MKNRIEKMLMEHPAESSLMKMMSDHIEYNKGLRSTVVKYTTEVADWKPVAYLNRIKFAPYKPATPNEKVGLSPVTVRRLAKDAEDEYYANRPRKIEKPELLVRDEETEGRWDRIVAHRMPNGGVRKIFYVGC